MAGEEAILDSLQLYLRSDFKTRFAVGSLGVTVVPAIGVQMGVG